MALIEAIGKGPVAIDTVVFIYFIEQHPRYVSILESLFEAIDKGHLRAFTSSLTLLETLVGSYRAGDEDLATRYETVLTTARGLTLVEVDRDSLRLAARIRAASGARTGDALQLAAALISACSVLVTNDRRMPSVGGLKILQLDALVGAT